MKVKIKTTYDGVESAYFDFTDNLFHCPTDVHSCGEVEGWAYLT